MRLTQEGGWGVLGLIFAGYVPLASQSPLLDLFCGQLLTSSCHFWAILSNFRHLNLVTFYLYIYPVTVNEEHFTFHLQYKHSGTFDNREYEEKWRKWENVLPHYSQSTLIIIIIIIIIIIMIFIIIIMIIIIIGHYRLLYIGSCSRVVRPPLPSFSGLEFEK